MSWRWPGQVLTKPKSKQEYKGQIDRVTQVVISNDQLMPQFCIKLLESDNQSTTAAMFSEEAEGKNLF